jgi:hypothetical protein
MSQALRDAAPARYASSSALLAGRRGVSRVDALTPRLSATLEERRLVSAAGDIGSLALRALREGGSFRDR